MRRGRSPRKLDHLDEGIAFLVEGLVCVRRETVGLCSRIGEDTAPRSDVVARLAPKKRRSFTQTISQEWNPAPQISAFVLDCDTVVLGQQVRIVYTFVVACQSDSQPIYKQVLAGTLQSIYLGGRANRPFHRTEGHCRSKTAMKVAATLGRHTGQNAVLVSG